MAIDPLKYPIAFRTPRRLNASSAWLEHIPFAMFLVDLLRPDVVLELGTQKGDSYCAFCEAVDVLGLSTRCYAVDTWAGDPQSGTYGPEVLADLRAHHDPLYGGFSRLIQSTFDEALAYFADGSIDLLHIDGYHTYEAVRHDFEAWLPKMSRRGVVLFHDINVRERDFGAWRLWDEVKGLHPSLAFVHTHGLGVLGVGAALPDGTRELFGWSDEETIAVRSYFFRLGHGLRLLTDVDVAQRCLADERAERERVAGSLRGDLERANEAGVKRDRVIDALKGQLEQAKEVAAAQERVAESLKGALQDAKDTGAEWERAAESLKGELHQAKEAVAEQGRSVESLRDELERAEQTGSDREREMQLLQGKIERAREQELYSVQRETAGLRHELNTLLNSRSWKLTAPLRRLWSALEGLNGTRRS
jgi:O-antigen biosynthesis protein